MTKKNKSSYKDELYDPETFEEKWQTRNAGMIKKNEEDMRKQLATNIKRQEQLTDEVSKQLPQESISTRNKMSIRESMRAPYRRGEDLKPTQPKEMSDVDNYKAEENLYKAYKDTQKMAKGGAVRSSASKRADGCAVKGFTRAK
jgi:hypothetical protein